MSIGVPEWDAYLDPFYPTDGKASMASTSTLTISLENVRVRTKEEAMKVVGYARVSTIGQAKDGLGVPTQERLIRAWARKEKHRLVRIVSENGKSGTLEETARPGLLEVLTAIRRGEAESVVVTSLDRLARALTVQEGVLAKLWAMGAEVYTVDGGPVPRDDPDDPMRTALRQIVGVFAELDRRLIVKRLRNGRMTKANRGGYSVGAPRFGWRAEGGELVTDPEEQATIKRMRSLKRKGMSLEGIAATLNSEGLRPRRGLKWYAKTVSRVLVRD